MKNPNKNACIEGCGGICCTRIEELNVTIGKTQILKDVNLHIHCGEITAIIGPNGAGKSTLLKALLGEVKHTGGLKYIDEKGRRTGKPLIGYVPQSLNFDRSTPTSVQDLFTVCLSHTPAWFGRSKHIRNVTEDALKKVKADHLIDRRLGALSGGELQRVLLALALEPLPDILLLDEPVSGVDHNGLELFYETVSELRNNFDLSIILVSHDLDLIYQYADRVVLLNGKVVVSGTPQEVYKDEKLIKTFGMSVLKGLGKELGE